MSVWALTSDPFNDMPIVVLRDREAKQTLPIRIGLGEACAIASELDNIELDRPLPHDLITSMLGHLDAAVEEIEIRDIVDGTCYATVWVRSANGERVGLDARPSDALALALRSKAPISVAAHVIEAAPATDLGPCEPLHRARTTTEPPGAMAVAGGAGAGTGDEESLGALGDEAFGKWKM